MNNIFYNNTYTVTFPIFHTIRPEQVLYRNYVVGEWVTEKQKDDLEIVEFEDPEYSKMLE